MALRKKPQTEYVKDSSVADNTDLTVHMLGPNDFDRYIKMCFNGKVDSVSQLCETAKIHLGRIKVKPNVSKAVEKIPDNASNNVNPQSLYVWMEKLSKRHRKAVAQLVALHATACRRLEV